MCARLDDVAALLEPERAEFGRELRLLGGAHRQLRFGVRERQHRVPILALRCKPAQLRERDSQRRIERNRFAEADLRAASVAAALVERLREAQHHARAKFWRALRRQIECGKPALVQLDQLTPLTRDEQRFLQRRECDPVLGLGFETGAQRLRCSHTGILAALGRPLRLRRARSAA